ncbi:MAG: M48 family metallopeptidase [Chitinophagaceae bacterium]|nr:M48 family metallopeptidase [Chitinophagaceae bacterium]
MKYVGIDTQIRRNNFYSVLLLLTFPALLLALSYFILLILKNKLPFEHNSFFLKIIPVIIGVVLVWFLIAWFSHSALIRMATGSRPLNRMENKRVYNLVENLCIAQGMPMPKVYIIDDESLNAFASGIDERTFAVSLSRGIIEKLNDEELEGVIAHELTHIRNRDVRLLIISIIFVGIFAFIAEYAFRYLNLADAKDSKDSKSNLAIMLAIIAVTAIAYLLSVLLRFGISRRREYMADAGASEMTKKPYALASALRKISSDPNIEAVKSRDVAQLFIENPGLSSHPASFLNKLFATHPPIEKRISLLEQFV